MRRIKKEWSGLAPGAVRDNFYVAAIQVDSKYHNKCHIHTNPRTDLTQYNFVKRNLDMVF